MFLLLSEFLKRNKKIRFKRMLGLYFTETSKILQDLSQLNAI